MLLIVTPAQVSEVLKSNISVVVAGISFTRVCLGNSIVLSSDLSCFLCIPQKCRSRLWNLQELLVGNGTQGSGIPCTLEKGQQAHLPPAQRDYYFLRY